MSLDFFFKKEKFQWLHFKPLRQDYIIAIMNKSIIFNAFRLNLKIDSLKDSLLLYFTPKRLIVVFFGFLLLKK